MMSDSKFLSQMPNQRHYVLHDMNTNHLIRQKSHYLIGNNLPTKKCSKYHY